MSAWRAPGSEILGFQNPARLSRAEFRVCMLIAEGAGNAEICAALSLSESTVRAHVRTICIKTGSTDRDALLAQLGRRGAASKRPDAPTQAS